jgi:hypothetical protein
MNMLQTDIQEVNRDEWLEIFKDSWQQGEHVVVAGPTGTGKTFFSQPILDIREWVCVIAVKPKDDTLERFKQSHLYGYKKYEIIKKWPPIHGVKRFILWVKPKGLHKLREQADTLHRTLNEMYREGGWTIYIDDTGYVTGTLGLGQAVGVLLNQGRSSGLTIVICVQRSTSVVARVPKEAFSQPRHKLIFKYENRDELKAVSQVVDIDLKTLSTYMDMLNSYYPKGYTDFIYVGKGKTYLVRNQGQENQFFGTKKEM